jgi:hypothetical protein
MMRLGIPLLAAMAVSALYANSAQAEICMYRDAQGHVTYSNVTQSPPKGATKIRCFRETKPPATTSGNDSPRKTETKDTFPSVDRDTQRQRDASRRSILEEELATEERNLQEARRQLEEQESVRLGNESNYQRYLERVQPFREAVENHERNVQALRRELQNLR